MKRFLLLFSFLIPFNAIADSDGVFCIGKGYVALEARGLYIYDKIIDMQRGKMHVSENNTDSKAGVFIIFARDGDLSERIFVPVDFQQDRNRQISCEDNRVILTDGFEGNIIDLSDINNLVAKKAKVEKTDNYSNMQLPYIRQSKGMPIPSDDKEHLYWLVVDAFEQTAPSGYIMHHYSARAVKTDKWGNFMNSTHLADGINVETVDPY